MCEGWIIQDFQRLVKVRIGKILSKLPSTLITVVHNCLQSGSLEHLNSDWVIYRVLKE